MKNLIVAVVVILVFGALASASILFHYRAVRAEYWMNEYRQALRACTARAP